MSDRQIGDFSPIFLPMLTIMTKYCKIPKEKKEESNMNVFCQVSVFQTTISITYIYKTTTFLLLLHIFVNINMFTFMHYDKKE